MRLEDPHALRALLDELREAGAKLRRRPQHETLDALARVLDGWSDPGSAWRARLLEQLPAATGFSPETVRAGLDLALAGWSGDALRELVQRELPPFARLGSGSPWTAGFACTAVLLAGSIPMPTLLSLLTPLVLRSPLLAKCASRDPVTPLLVAGSIAETDAELGGCLRLVDFPGADPERMAALLEAECVVATGSDATIASVRARIPPTRRLVAHGHRLSLAALGGEALRPSLRSDVAERLALDVALWDQLGCLSPVAVYAVGDAAADALAEALAAALAALEQRMPRGRIDVQTASEIAHQRAEAELRAAAGARVAVHASQGTRWTVVREDACAVRPAPLHRFVRVFALSAPAELLAAAAPYATQLAGVALEGFGAETPTLARGLADLGASRVCAPGALQAPPLGWHRDGLGVLAPLARLSDPELLV